MIIGSTTKAVADNRDFQFDLTVPLAVFGDTISSVAWSVSASTSGVTSTLTQGTTSNTTTTATIWLSGGTDGGRHTVKVTVTTSAARTLIFFIEIFVTAV